MDLLHLISKAFSGVEVRILCRRLELLHTNHGKVCIYGRFVNRNIIMLEQLRTR